MYAELHARSAFSFLAGASLPEELVEVCAERGMGAMAVLDRDGMYGAPRFYMAAQKSNVRALVGAEVTSEEGWRYPLLVESADGYRNICRLITRMKMRARKGEGRISRAEMSDQLGNDAAGLVCLTGGDEGPLAHALASGGMPAATRCVQQLCEVFGKRNVYVELQRHFCRDEEVRNQRALEIARKLNLPVLATNGVSHALPEQRELLDVFSCVRHHRTLATAGRLLTRNAERHLKSPAEMAHLFADLPEAMANTEELAARLQFTLNDLGYQLPDLSRAGWRSQMQFLRERTYEGMLHRYGAGNERARAADRARAGGDRKTGSGRIFPDRVGHRSFLPRAKYSGAGARFGGEQRGLLLRWESPRSIRWAWSCCSSGFFPKNAANGRTSIWTCPAATSASAPFNMCISAMENWARP